MKSRRSAGESSASRDKGAPPAARVDHQRRFDFATTGDDGQLPPPPATTITGAKPEPAPDTAEGRNIEAGRPRLRIEEATTPCAPVGDRVSQLLNSYRIDLVANLVRGIRNCHDVRSFKLAVPLEIGNLNDLKRAATQAAKDARARGAYPDHPDRQSAKDILDTIEQLRELTQLHNTLGDGTREGLNRFLLEVLSNRLEVVVCADRDRWGKNTVPDWRKSLFNSKALKGCYDLLNVNLLPPFWSYKDIATGPFNALLNLYPSGYRVDGEGPSYQRFKERRDELVRRAAEKLSN